MFEYLIYTIATLTLGVWVVDTLKGGGESPSE